jgi:hypothetical protein
LEWAKIGMYKICTDSTATRDTSRVTPNQHMVYVYRPVIRSSVTPAPERRCSMSAERCPNP